MKVQLTRVQSALTEADKNGWAVLNMEPGRLEYEVRTATDYEVVAKSTLNARKKQDAKPGTLSSHVGLQQQPPHTDGAHLAIPPSYVLLRPQAATTTPTVVAPIDVSSMSVEVRCAGLNGVFKVRNGNNTFLTHGLVGRSIRYDPMCMHACDQRARDFERFVVESATASAFEYVHPESRPWLVLSNTGCLHGRASVPTDAEVRRIDRWALQRKGPRQ